MDAPRGAYTRRRFLGTSVLFVAGAAVSACTSDPLNKGARVTLRQWYHAYGEKGTQQAVERYAAEVQRR